MNRRPLADKTILVTRTSRQAASLSDRLRELGAKVPEVPTIEVVPLASPALDEAITQLKCYDWLMFTSVNGVDLFFRRCKELGKKGPFPRICSIGPATSDQIRANGFPVTLEPALFQAEGILEEFSSRYGGDLSQLRILLPRARVAREILPQKLRERGVQLDLIPVYETVIPRDSGRQLSAVLKRCKLDLVTLTSSSTVRNLVEMAPDFSSIQSLHYAAIGPITARTAEENGLKVVCMAEKSTIPDLVSAIANYFSPEEPPQS